MDLKTMVRCLADHYRWNEEVSQIEALAKTLRELSEECHGMMNDIRQKHNEAVFESKGER